MAEVLYHYNGVPVSEVSEAEFKSMPAWRPSTPEEVQERRESELAYKAERRVNAIRELAEMIAGGGSPVELAVQCVEALEDMGWADD